MRRDRFLKVTGATKQLDQATIDRARQLAGLKGYVTNLPATTMDGAAVIAAYHDLWRVAQSFRIVPKWHESGQGQPASLPCG